MSKTLPSQKPKLNQTPSSEKHEMEKKKKKKQK
jgi:hypothetical protein